MECSGRSHFSATLGALAGTVVLILSVSATAAFASSIEDTIVFVNTVADELVVFAAQSDPLAGASTPETMHRTLRWGQMAEMRPG